MTSLPPPDSVPMIDAPPPMSEPSSTTTPAEMRPSTIDVPSVPALKLTKPSCITVVPAARCAPSRTRSASAMRTPRGHARSRPSAGTCRRRRPATGPRRRSRARISSKPSTAQGPWLVHTTLVSTPNNAVGVEPVRRDQPVGEQVQSQVGVVGVGGLVAPTSRSWCAPGRSRRRGRRRGRPARRTPRGPRQPTAATCRSRPSRPVPVRETRCRGPIRRQRWSPAQYPKLQSRAPRYPPTTLGSVLDLRG